jgi:hypothetical protein
MIHRAPRLKPPQNSPEFLEQVQMAQSGPRHSGRAHFLCLPRGIRPHPRSSADNQVSEALSGPETADAVFLSAERPTCRQQGKYERDCFSERQDVLPLRNLPTVNSTPCDPG